MSSAARGSAAGSPSRHRYGHDPAHYPLKAIRYVLESPPLWRTILCAACAGVVVSLAVLILLFAVALGPQAEAFGGYRWWSWLLAVLAVLLEAAVASSLLLVLIQSKAQTEVFVATMRREERWREGEMTKPSTLKDLNLCRKAFWLRVLTCPLNLIPFAGPVLYSAINATFVGWDYMDRYFDAIGMADGDQRVEVFGADRSSCRYVCSSSAYDRDNGYARFGFACGLLEAVPVAGAALFPLTNACAAALFACDIEGAGGPASVGATPEGGDSASGGGWDGGGGAPEEGVAGTTSQGVEESRKGSKADAPVPSAPPLPETL